MDQEVNELLSEELDSAKAKIEELQDEISRLTDVVVAAYREGWDDALEYPESSCNHRWKCSIAKNQI